MLVTAGVCSVDSISKWHRDVLKVSSHVMKFSPSPIFNLLLFSIVSMKTG